MNNSSKNNQEKQKEDPQNMLPESGGTHDEGTTGISGISGPQGYVGDHD